MAEEQEISHQQAQEQCQQNTKSLANLNSGQNTRRFVSITEHFANSKTRSCKKIMQKAGQVIAVPYTSAATYDSKPSIMQQLPISTRDVKTSTFKEAYQTRFYLHAGMQGKPLEPYSPLSYRSRLQSPRHVVSSQYESQIRFGDPKQRSRLQYVSTYKSYMNHNHGGPFTLNSGIKSQQTKWIHSRINI